MASTRKCVIISNFNFHQEETFWYAKLKDQWCIPNCVPSENSQEERKFENNQRNLPLKKRFCGAPENAHLDCMKTSGEYLNPWIQLQHRTTEDDQNFLKRKPKKAKIFPGVIRHTSCPGIILAYYYNYSSE